MENKNLKDLVDAMLDKQREGFEVIEAKNAIELKSLKDDLIKNSDLLKDEVKKIQDELFDVETRIKKSNVNRSDVPITNSIYNQLNSKEFSDSVIVNAIKGGNIDFSFSTKLIRNSIHQPTNFIDGDAPVVLPMREIGIDKAPVAPPAVSDLIQWGTTSSNMVDWIERTGKVNAAAMREDGLMTEGSLEYTEVSTKVKIMSEYMKVTNESLKDVDFLASEINTELLSDLKVLLDYQLLSGDGVGNNLKGILSYATDWAAGSFTASIVNPNYADVLRIGINQIFEAGQGRWFPTAILMHPADVSYLDLLKIADGRYIEVPFYDNEQQSVIKVPVYMNVNITQGEFLIADFSKAKAFVRDELAIRVYNQNEDDAIRNRSTVTANLRLAFRIKNQEVGAFVKGDFTSAITDLTKP
jgi:HK97 family phage major capsid protein